MVKLWIWGHRKACSEEFQLCQRQCHSVSLGSHRTAPSNGSTKSRGKNIRNGKGMVLCSNLWTLCLWENTLSFCLPGKTSCRLFIPSQTGLIEIVLLGKGKESWKVTPIYLKCLNQVHLHTERKYQKVAIHYCITAIVCSVISDDR